MDEDDLKLMPLNTLKALCNRRGLNNHGTKEVLIGRLTADFEEGNNILRNPVPTTITPNSRNDERSAINENHSQILSFKDIEDSMETFAGEKMDDVDRWIKNFEEVAVMMQWNDVQKFIHGRRLLRGTAKQFINCSTNINSYTNFKAALMDEFDVKPTSAEIHELLRRRKKNYSESYLQYVYSMQDIAKKIGMEERAVCQYIADGIKDDPMKKMCLYEATTIKMMKEKLIQYENITKRINESKNYNEKRRTIQETNLLNKKTTEETNSTKNKEDVRCFNCGEKGHRSTTCPNLEKGPKCFICNDFNHKSINCPNRKKPKISAIKKNDELHNSIDVKFGDQIIKAVVDTQRDFTFIQEDELKRTKQYVDIKEDNIPIHPFIGFGDFLVAVDCVADPEEMACEEENSQSEETVDFVVDPEEVALRRFKKEEDCVTSDGCEGGNSQSKETYNMNIHFNSSEIDIPNNSVEVIQNLISSTEHREIQNDVFIETRMILKDDIPIVMSDAEMLRISEVIENEKYSEFDNHRNELREEAVIAIVKSQEQGKKYYDKRRKKSKKI